MKLQQHLEALQEIEWKLQGQYGNCTPIYGRHEFGRFTQVVNMAFAHWSDLDAVASNRNYQDEVRNTAADEAAESLDTIKALAKELYEQERMETTDIARELDEQLEALRELDAVHTAASVRWGF